MHTGDTIEGTVRVPKNDEKCGRSAHHKGDHLHRKFSLVYEVRDQIFRVKLDKFWRKDATKLRYKALKYDRGGLGDRKKASGVCIDKNVANK